MAIDPNSTTAAATTTIPTTTTTATISTRPFTNPPSSRPISPLHHHHHHPITTVASPFSAQQPLYAAPTRTPPSSSYPVASSGRGFLPKAPRPDQTVTVANPGGYPSRPLVVPGFHHSAGVRPHLDSHHMVRPLQNLQHHLYHHPHPPHLASPAAPIKGLPLSVPSKVTSSSSVPDCNGHKDMRDKSRDDTLTTVRDRKCLQVRIVEGASLYTLCRSWLKNGVPEETQPQYGDGVRSLPKPLPIPVATGNLQKKESQEEDDDGGEEEEESVKDLSAEDLLKGHVKRAKSVRARLREVRLKRIARYKSRLALLLPPLVEQFRNDVAAGT